jgi:hypothetical protein
VTTAFVGNKVRSATAKDLSEDMYYLPSHGAETSTLVFWQSEPPISNSRQISGLSAY